MSLKRSRVAALVALVALSFTTAANAEMMRAFWSGNILDAVTGNAYDLATGDKLFVEMNFDNQWLSSFASFDGQVLAVAAAFDTNQPSGLGQASLNSVFTGELRFLDNMNWQAFENGQMFAAGTWSMDSIKFAPRVIPIPAAFPLLLGALGILGVLRRRS